MSDHRHTVKVWDRFVRVFHWTLVASFATALFSTLAPLYSTLCATREIKKNQRESREVSRAPTPAGLPERVPGP
ncbi:MAG: hypothetical protein IT372_33755 [Polyangiaceae bacterium]|nr:hypothetical protein [Polyangiaceae bacterium]